MTWVILNVLTGETITGGKLVIDVSYFGWHIHSETHDLCEESSCPVSSGDFVISHTQVLPGFTPPVLKLIGRGAEMLYPAKFTHTVWVGVVSKISELQTLVHFFSGHIFADLVTDCIL
ncbi:hypothetical protein CK203_060071 [Vitis vinifera]|uniref:MD-2-related lipid-recognition domain-containing protein n=1 Tax=Vitis vinifera TaxID=29760 RepID=A0A438GK27_VITVI|nr:hypothetical protein CK203_060071 [Vitis vinifera]